MTGPRSLVRLDRSQGVRPLAPGHSAQRDATTQQRRGIRRRVVRAALDVGHEVTLARTHDSITRLRLQPTQEAEMPRNFGTIRMLHEHVQVVTGVTALVDFIKQVVRHPPDDLA